MVWEDEIDNVVNGAYTLIVTNAVAADSQVVPFKVDNVNLRYWVVTVKPDGTSYVDDVALPIGVQLGVVRLVFDSQR